MALGNHSESALVAMSKRKAQVERWQKSETEKEAAEIRNRPKRVKFADKCIFQAACAANDKAQVAKMIEEGYNINAVDEDGITALHQVIIGNPNRACIEDNFDMVEFLLAHGADVNISDNEGWTPLHAVATCCYVSIAKLLLKHDANVVALNNDCCIPLDICKSDEIRELFKQAISMKGIDLGEARKGEEIKMMEDAKHWLTTGIYEEEPHPTTGATAMHVAACKGYIKVLDQLIKAGASINAKDYDGWTPLHAAAHWGQEEACRVLLEAKADINMKNNCDQTPLDVAELSVVPIFDEHKKKLETTKKSIESPTTGKSNILPLPPKKKVARLLSDEESGLKKRLEMLNTSGSGMAELNFQSRRRRRKTRDEEFEANEAGDTVGELPSSSSESLDMITTGTVIVQPSSTSNDINLPPTNDQIVSELSQTRDASGEINQSHVDIVINSSEPSAPSKVLESLKIPKSSTSENDKDSNTVPGLLTPSVSSSSKADSQKLEVSGDVGDENTPAWRRGGSLRTKTTPSPDEDKSNDRSAVRRTRSAASTDVNLRRAYSFESDSKFYTRLLTARNRIKAIEEASAAMSTSNLLDKPSLITNVPSTNSNSRVAQIAPIYEPTRLTSTDNNKPNNDTYNAASSENTTTTTKPVILRRKENDSTRPQRPTTISSLTQARVPSSAVQMRSGESGNSLSPGTPSPTGSSNSKTGTVTKIKQFIKSFVPPARDEESETQRKAHAKRVRETRRSTQGVTLEELKSAEQYVKSQQSTNTQPTNDQIVGGSQQVFVVPAPSSNTTGGIRKTEDSLERRPSWRLRVDDSDRSKFSLEDTRGMSQKGAGEPGKPETERPEETSSLPKSPSLRSRALRNEYSVSTRPPKPPEDNAALERLLGDEDKEGKLSGAQLSSSKKRKPKRRSTGVVTYHSDESDDREIGTSDKEGSVKGSDVETGAESSRSENGIVSRVNYKKLYEEMVKENQHLKSRITAMEEQVTDLKAKATERTQEKAPRISLDSVDKREKRVLEQRLREMEEELRSLRGLAAENQKLRDENGALIRVISKLSK